MMSMVYRGGSSKLKSWMIVLMQDAGWRIVYWSDDVDDV